MNIPENIDAHNQDQFDLISTQFSKEFPQQSIVVFNDYSFRDQALQRVVEEVPHLSHVALDLGETQVDSLAEVIRAKLEDMIEEGNASNILVHVVNLESSFFEEIITGENTLISNLNEFPNQAQDTFGANYIFWTDNYAKEKFANEAVEFSKHFQQTYSILTNKKADKDPYQGLAILKEQLSHGELSKETEGKTKLEIGDIFHTYQKWKRALEFYEEAQTLGEETEVAAAATASIGILHFEQRDLAQAQKFMEEGLAGLEETEDFLLLKALTHQNLAAILGDSGLYDESIDHYANAAAIFETLEDFEKSAHAHLTLSRVLERKGHWEKAIRSYENAGNQFSEAGMPLDTARAFQQIGAIWQARLQWQDALNAFKNALVEAEKTDDDFLIAALEDSVEAMEEKEKSKPKKESGKKKGFFGKLFG